MICYQWHIRRTVTLTIKKPHHFGFFLGVVFISVDFPLFSSIFSFIVDFKVVRRVFCVSGIKLSVQSGEDSFLSKCVPFRLHHFHTDFFSDFFLERIKFFFTKWYILDVGERWFLDPILFPWGEKRKPSIPNRYLTNSGRK